jgi:hypothetical protein
MKNEIMLIKFNEVGEGDFAILPSSIYNIK